MSGVRVLGALAGLAVLSLPFLFLKAWRRRHEIHAGAFAWGVLIWVLGSGLGWAVVQAYAGPVSEVLAKAASALGEGVLDNLAAALIYAALETSLVLWVALRGPYQEASWEKGICFGLGYGAAQSVVYGLGLSAAWILPGLLPAEARQALDGIPALAAAAPLVERTFGYLTHMYAALAVFYAVRSQSWKWVGWAAAYKFLFYAVTAVGWGLGSAEALLHNARDLWTVQLAVFAFGALGLSGLLHLGYVYHRLGDGPGLTPPPAKEGTKKEAKGAAAPAPEAA